MNYATQPKARYVDHMGDDLSIVNAARVSFGHVSHALGKREVVIDSGNTAMISEITQRDRSLIRYLARGISKGDFSSFLDELSKLFPAKDRESLHRVLRSYVDRPLHWSPFAHVTLKVWCDAPIAVARQMETHQVGLAANEVSGRYTDNSVTFSPLTWRESPVDLKHGRGEEFDFARSVEIDQVYHEAGRNARLAFERLREMGVCYEQARFILPQAQMTTWIWTGSLAAFARIYNNRVAGDAQQESEELARQIGDIAETIFPVAWKALTTSERYHGC
jgi:thymidylate synthase (FAD)